MSFTVQQATKEDAPKLATVFFAAFCDGFNRRMLPPVPDVQAWAIEHVVGGSSTQEREVFLKITDPSNPDVVVAFAKWICPLNAEDRNPNSELLVFPPSGDAELCARFFRLMAEHHDRLMGDRPHYYLDLFGVHPSFQRLGLGAKLLEWGLSRADQEALLEWESAAADIVLHTADASDPVGAAKAIAAGLAAGHSQENPGYWLHTGGTGILTFEDNDKNQYGFTGDKVYNDWEGVNELLTLPDHAFHRNVDQIVLEAGTNQADVIRTALVCPPTIYGRGRGPCSRRGRQVYELANVTLRLQSGPIIGPGQSIWNNVHIHDLSDVYALLVDAAVAGRTDEGLWGAKAYYLTENGAHCWGELAKRTAAEAAKLGYLPEAKSERIDLESAKKYAGFESLSWGMNSRGSAVRAHVLLGWSPYRPSLDDELPEIVESEYQRLQRHT